ncbi:MAG: hypothetical protein EAX95_04505 [Candidatus Thorarchaeota archaeon]|nr:hypothetical protein [Candidatus Thorarchaeota archaeon]
MEKSTYIKISSSALFVHGIIEILAMSMFLLPPELIPVSLSEDAAFWALIGAMYGAFRIGTGYLVAKKRRNGILLGIFISVVTLAVAPHIHPFGLLDLPFAMIVLWALTTLWSGDEAIAEEE